jgi:CarD family transcriptional regulator
MGKAPGETLVHPRHGVAVVERTESRVLEGSARDYLVLRVVRDGMTLMVPADSPLELGMRPVISPSQVERVLEVLCLASPVKDGSWSRRLKANQDKMRSGDAVALAEVVRDLSLVSRHKVLAPGEKRMLQTAYELLVAELAIASGRDGTSTQQLVDHTLALAPDTAPLVAPGDPGARVDAGEAGEAGEADEADEVDAGA